MTLTQKQIEYYRLVRARRDLEIEKILDEKQALSISAAMDSKCAGTSKGIKGTGNKWLPCDDSGDVYSHDVLIAVGDGVSVKELTEQRKKLLQNGVKVEPDIETMEFWNQQRTLEQQKLWVDQIDQILNEIEAL